MVSTNESFYWGGMKMSYICPVCGFIGLKQPPYDENGNESLEICHCCGFEFGTDEYLYSFESIGNSGFQNYVRTLSLS
jgi:hypothetical protein